MTTSFPLFALFLALITGYLLTLDKFYRTTLFYLIILKTLFKILIICCAVGVLYSCARMGRPEGGPRDVLPPLYIRSTPPMGAKNVTSTKIELVFDELVALKDQSEKVIVSPAQSQQPIIRANGRRISIEFRDTLLENTTYTVDFADAIQDFTEGNPLENFAYVFSTGDTIDSLQIAGILLDAHNLEPMQKMLVGVHSNLHDSAFTSSPFERVARTNDRGEFVIRNLKPGQYRLYAINDVDRNNLYSPGEDIAFYSDTITPTMVSTTGLDTLYTPTHEIDTVIPAIHTKFYPNNILLSMFNENIKTQYLVKDERQDSTRLYFEFGAASDTLPTLTLIDYPDITDWYKLNRSMTNDTLTYWITDTTLIKLDTIRVAASYLRTDTLKQLSLTTDTILFKYKRSKVKKEKKKKKGDDEEADSIIPRPDPAKFDIVSKGAQDVNLPLIFKAEVPLRSINQKAVHLYHKIDSLWEDVDAPIITLDNDYSLHNYHADYEWIPGDTYRLFIDSAAIVDIYGLVTDSIVSEFNIKKLDEYCDVTFKINISEPAFVELMQSDDKPLYTASVIDGEAFFSYVNPGNYYARLIVDKNGNGKWDTGVFNSAIQPEDVYYYNKKLNLRRNWDIEENWDLSALPVDMQKPLDIKKNKPQKKKWEEVNKNLTDDEDEYNEEDEIFDVNRNPFAPASNSRKTTHY